MDIFTSPSQIASSLSIEASIGSIMIGLLLISHNRSRPKEDPAGAVSGQSRLICVVMCAEVTQWQSTYLYQNAHTTFGLEPMAIVFSLPWALLMWSYVISCLFRGCTRFTFMKSLLDRMVIFFVALLLFCFSISNVSTRIFVTISSVLVITLIGWCIRIIRQSTEDEDVWQKSLAVLRRTRGALFERVKNFNPFHTHRFLNHDTISLNSRSGEVRV